MLRLDNHLFCLELELGPSNHLTHLLSLLIALLAVFPSVKRARLFDSFHRIVVLIVLVRIILKALIKHILELRLSLLFDVLASLIDLVSDLLHHNLLNLRTNLLDDLLTDGLSKVLVPKILIYLEALSRLVNLLYKRKKCMLNTYKFKMV